jgi:hypothetical protein
MGDQLISQAKSMLKRVVEATDDRFGFGTLSCTVYDTAWVALVSKQVDGKRCWLFPESFEYILRTQSPDGLWSEDTGAQIDGVLNTMAGLLVLLRYRAEPLQTPVYAYDLEARIRRARSALQSRMAVWDVTTSNNVGVEIIVPALLDMLQKEDASLVFDFKGKDALMEANKRKIGRFKPDLLYSGEIMTLTHSLEAFIGKIDFDRMAPHTVMGSMFASPSSTAAYLTNASTWDDEAEAYLRHAINASSGLRSGGVPGVFPTTHFEYTWILSTLLRAGFTPSELSSPELDKMKDLLVRNYRAANGALGLAPGIEPDVDDSAKAITTINLLGGSEDAARLCEVFEKETHFRVYPGERDSSFSANCNVLAALLHQPDTQKYSAQISKVAKFICEKRWRADGDIDDKWNTSHLYSSFLYTQAMVDLMALSEAGGLAGVFDRIFLTKVSVTLFQSCLRAMLEQKSSGSWNESPEETAYAILMLTEARRLCLFKDLKEPLENSIQRGISFLTTNTHPLNYIWSDKVSYGSSFLTQAYTLAARRAASTAYGSGVVGASVWEEPTSKQSTGLLRLFCTTPLFRSVDEWEVRASLIEASIYQPLLRDPELEILDRKDVHGGQYLQIIPFTWTSCNNRIRSKASASHLWELMVLSFFTYQVDEFMEAMAGPAFKGRMATLHRLIDKAVSRDARDTNVVHSNGDAGWQGNGEATSEFASKISKAVDFILNNPVVCEASPYDRKSLRQELGVFLHAHATQVEDNMRFGKMELLGEATISSYPVPFFRWVRTTSADHIAGAFCFYYAVCLLGATLTSEGSRDCFPTPMEKYFAATTCTHLSTMTRMYNDLGSWTRDREEGNLSCLHFPELSGAGRNNNCQGAARKAALGRMAKEERNRWHVALQQLCDEMRAAAPDAAAARLAGRRARLVTMFCDVTDLYGEIYVLRDVSTRIKDEVRNG